MMLFKELLVALVSMVCAAIWIFCVRFPQKADEFIEKYFKGPNSPYSDEAWKGSRQRLAFVAGVWAVIMFVFVILALLGFAT